MDTESQTTILDIVQEVSIAFADGDNFVSTCSDLTKAFDLVDHNLLLKKLHFYGIRGTTHKLLESYLPGREQITKYEDTSSEPIKIEKGVP